MSYFVCYTFLNFYQRYWFTYCFSFKIFIRTIFFLLSLTNSKQLVFQPRLVIQGDTSTCLHMNFIPSLLEDLEGFSHHKIDIDILNCQNNLSAAYSTITSVSLFIYLKLMYYFSGNFYL